METIRIFLASSSELQQERKEFREFLSIENDRLNSKGVYLKLFQWENFLDAVSPTSLQDEYDKELKKAQIVICLFYTKAGKYTQEEFDTALQQFKETGSPLIYTYFRSGAPEPERTDELAMELVRFKERLAEIGHFFTVYKNIDDLKYQFRKQLDKLEDKGFIVLQNELKRESKEAVEKYFNTNVAVTRGHNNIIIQGVTNSSITVNVNGQLLDIEKKLEALQSLMENKEARSIQTANNIYNIGTITNANFGYLVNQVGRNKSLPAELTENLVGEGNGWIQSLKQELQNRQRISVGSRPWDIFQNYGWLIETFLQKMGTAAGKEQNLRRLSFIAEAWQSSLRYLCFIQMAQILQMENKPQLGIISDFFQMEGTQYLDFDYTSLLLTATECIGENGFLIEINNFLKELTNTESVLYETILFLEDKRKNLMTNNIPEDDALPNLLNEYLTALVYWLRKVSFLCKYRLVSIKEINLNYRLGSAKNFVHLYGELHGLYSDIGVLDEDYTTISIEDSFTYNKSILLFRGTDVSSGMERIGNRDEYLSLSPLVIDQSVYAGKPTQTPEIFYFTGYDKAKRQYNYSQYKNELAFGGKDEIASNKFLNVKAQNNNQPRLNELFEQLEEIFKPLKIKQE